MNNDRHGDRRFLSLPPLRFDNRRQLRCVKNFFTPEKIKPFLCVTLDRALGVGTAGVGKWKQNPSLTIINFSLQRHSIAILAIFISHVLLTSSSWFNLFVRKLQSGDGVSQQFNVHSASLVSAIKWRLISNCSLLYLSFGSFSWSSINHRMDDCVHVFGNRDWSTCQRHLS